MNCKIGIISWPTKNKTETTGFICFGEIYDNTISTSSKTLSLLSKELSYLYPFVCTVSNSNIAFSNIEDLNFYRQKYKLTFSIKIYGKITQGKHVFHTPVLYDFNCNKSFVYKPYPRSFLPSPHKKICIVFPYDNPIKRGELLSHVLENNINTFMLIGNTWRQNKDSISTLMARFLLLRGVPTQNIIKCRENKKPECFLTALALLKAINMYIDYEICVACLSQDINSLLFAFKIWRNKGEIEQDRRFGFICPFI